MWIAGIIIEAAEQWQSFLFVQMVNFWNDAILWFSWMRLLLMMLFSLCFFLFYIPPFCLLLLCIGQCSFEYIVWIWIGGTKQTKGWGCWMGWIWNWILQFGLLEAILDFYSGRIRKLSYISLAVHFIFLRG